MAGREMLALPRPTFAADVPGTAQRIAVRRRYRPHAKAPWGAFSKGRSGTICDLMVVRCLLVDSGLFGAGEQIFGGMERARGCARTPLTGCGVARRPLAAYVAGIVHHRDLRQFTGWCRARALALLAVRRADIETFARDLEARGRARATVTRHGPQGGICLDDRDAVDAYARTFIPAQSAAVSQRTSSISSTS